MSAKRKPRKPIDLEFGPEVTAPAVDDPPITAAKLPVKPTPAAEAKRKTGPSVVVAPAAPVRTINMDRRVLNKKQQSKLSHWTGTQRGKAMDTFFKEQMEHARRQFGHSSVIAGNSDNALMVCIPCPLAFQYLIGQSGFPLGLFVHVFGPPGTNKSALLYEIFNWFGYAGGMGHLLNTEDKYSESLLHSLNGYEDEADKRLVMVDPNCQTLEDWQQRLNFHIMSDKHKMLGTKDDPGPGRTLPICFGIDSVMGKPAVETQENIGKQGFADRSFPLEALKINPFVKTMAGFISGWPFTIILNNHMKTGANSQGIMQKRTGGGATINFQESFGIETAIRKKDITSQDWDGTRIVMRCTKNSFAQTGRSIEARMLWWDVKNPTKADDWRQHTVWDWDWSTVQMLVNIEGRQAARLKELDVHVRAIKSSDVENTAYSGSLGMKEKDAVSWSELGRMIVQNKDLVRRIRSALGITERPMLAGDYLKQLETCQKTLR